MIATFRQSWNRNRSPFLMKMKNLIIKVPIWIGEPPSTFIRQQWSTGYGLAWCLLHSESKKEPKTICNTSVCSKMRWQQQTNGFARKLQSRCLLLPHPSAFPLLDLLIDITNLHRHESNHPNICLVPICLVSFLHNCSKLVSSCLAGGEGGD